MTTPDHAASSMPLEEVPALATDAAREMYHLAEAKYHVSMDVLLENAGRSTAALVSRIAPGTGHLVVLAGKGLNGADALAAARHLTNAGWDVEVGLAVPIMTLAEFSRRQLSALEASGVRVREVRTETINFEGCALVLDGLLGSNARGPPRPPMDTLIKEANAADAGRIALDVPTGVDPDQGSLNGDAFRAEATLMLGLPKAGTVAPTARPFAGDLYLGEVSLPRGVYAHFGATRPPFDAVGLVALER